MDFIMRSRCSFQRVQWRTRPTRTRLNDPTQGCVSRVEPADCDTPAGGGVGGGSRSNYCCDFSRVLFVRFGALGGVRKVGGMMSHSFSFPSSLQN